MAEELVLEEGTVETSFNTKAYNVAPTPPDHVRVKSVMFMEFCEFVKVIAVGGAIAVVIVMGDEEVEPMAFTAYTTSV